MQDLKERAENFLKRMQNLKNAGRDLLPHDDEVANIIKEFAGREATLVEALRALVGSNGCLGYVRNHDTLKDALIFRGGRLDVDNFHPKFQETLREVLDNLIKAKTTLKELGIE